MEQTRRAPDWDAKTYHRVSEPQFAWGLKVLARIPLRGDETVIDAGCGTGRLTSELLDRLPQGRALAIDSSPRMLDSARELLLKRFQRRVSFLRADLMDLELFDFADVVFSTATFHWIPDHDRLFRNLFAALHPGGFLYAQCGGGANLERLRDRAANLMRSDRFAPFFLDWANPWNYATPEASADRLLTAGFEEVETSLEPSPTPMRGEVEYRDFASSVVLRTHVAKISDPRARDAFLDEMTAQAGRDDPPFTLDYWRLNLRAKRPG